MGGLGGGAVGSYGWLRGGRGGPDRGSSRSRPCCRGRVRPHPCPRLPRAPPPRPACHARPGRRPRRCDPPP
eukprot:scaffold122436_cov52-Phaeocystis_antarctica.AAC.3